MFGRSHFRRHKHAEFFLHAFEPGQAQCAYAFKASGLGARFPYAGAEYLDAFFTKLGGGVHHLLFGLGRTRTGNYDGAFVVNAR